MFNDRFKRKCANGFTLTELLISLAILGEIATFTIPKVLTAQKNQRFNAIAKETAGMITSSYLTYKQSNMVSSSTFPSTLFNYMNALKTDTSTVIDGISGDPPYTCSGASPCIVLHNGAILMAWAHAFGGTSNLSAIQFMLDPDGRNTGNSDTLNYVLYYNGRLTTWNLRTAGTSDDRGNLDGNGFPADPTWFSW